jgi:hypothetical protein
MGGIAGRQAMLRAFDEICYCSYERHFLTYVLGHRTSGGGGGGGCKSAASRRRRLQVGHVPVGCVCDDDGGGGEDTQENEKTIYYNKPVQKGSLRPRHQRLTLDG